MTVIDDVLRITLDEMVLSGMVVRTTSVSDKVIGAERDPMGIADRECYLCKETFLYDPDRDDHIMWNTYRGWNALGVQVYDHHYMCDNCVAPCEDCGDNTPAVKNNTMVANRWLYVGKCPDCSDNYGTCQRCDDTFHNDEINIVQSTSYCEDCCSRVANWCENCEEYEYHDEVCNSSNGNIHGYGYKPNAVFYGTDEDNSFLRFGIELEVEAKSGDLGEGAELMTKEWGEFTYLKEDSSLNFGFEIVTHPASLEYYQKEVKWSAINRLRDMGFRSWNTSTCGIHVHIDRRAFKDRTHLMACSHLLNNNEDLSIHIAGRNSEDYGVISSHGKRDNINTIKGYARGRGGDRYLAMNLQNSATVEMRMFKGSLKVERILSGIEYCHALVQYSRNIRSGLQAKDMLRTEEFISWIRKQGIYPNLVQFLPDLAVVSTDNDNGMEE